MKENIKLIGHQQKYNQYVMEEEINGKSTREATDNNAYNFFLGGGAIL